MSSCGACAYFAALCCLLLLVPISYVLSLCFTNVYAWWYEPEGTNLAKVSGDALLELMLFVVFCGFCCGCNKDCSPKSEKFAITACIIILFSITAGIMICVSTSRCDSDAGKAIGALAAVFTFSLAGIPWCLLASHKIAFKSDSEKSNYEQRIRRRSPQTRRRVYHIKPISGHQEFTEQMPGHHESAKPISGHHASTERISGFQASTEPISGLQASTEPISGLQESAHQKTTILDKMSEEDKRKFFQVRARFDDNIMTGEDIQILIEMQQKYV